MMDPPTALFTSTPTETSLYSIMPPTKRKRRPAGTPDPDAEVIALSPHTLMESDSYVCEICNLGFQRDQNLQMHRRRHKVPWKLLKRAEPEIRKRVYVCPEPSCLHHDPCHALGDMVGIKKHYRRKHSSMKQWECDKCSKAYAVQSDYKAHLKTCGTRGHCCDCGRVFSRIESFIEHQDTCLAPRRNKKLNAANGLEAAASLHVADGQDRSGILLHPLPVQILSAPPASPASALTTQSHACNARPPPAPTSKSYLNQVESSQGSVACGKDINPCSSETTATKPAEDKCALREGVDYLEMLPLSGTASTDAEVAPAVCLQLQLCIGMSNSGQFTNINGKSTSSLQVATSTANQEERPALDLRADLLQTDQRSDSSSGSIKDPDFVMPYKVLSERASRMSQRLSFLSNPDHMMVPAAEAAEVLLQEAREKLRRASAEKLEAEKAWREARREREQAEQELAKAQRITEYNGRVARAGKLGADDLQLALQKPDGGGGRRKPTCSSSTSSSPCSSIANSQAATSSLQNIRQGHAPATCITCPTCLHTQIFYPSPARNSMGTLFF